MADPNVSFIFPLRWLKPEGLPFLTENLKRQINSSESKVYYHPKIAPNTTRYQAVLKIRAWQPVKLPIPKAEFQKHLEAVFPRSECISLDVYFLQNDNAGGVPVLELEIYF